MDISEKHQARLVRPPDQAPLPGPGLLDLSMPNIASLDIILIFTKYTEKTANQR